MDCQKNENKIWGMKRMRELKFRAWDKNLKQMEEVIAIDFDSEKVLCHPDYYDWRPFGQIELMQYTSIKDKNKKEIYKDDIVYISGIGNCVVKWDEVNACWIFVHKQELPFINETFCYQDICEDLENVVGNIYENPELLKQS